MNEAAAREQLQTIRTLMERAALYRRALAPMMFTAGVLGLGAAAIGWLMPLVTAPGFLTLWLVTALAALAFSFLLIRRQALIASEPFWTPPTRRVALAALPAVFVGVVTTLLLLVLDPSAGRVVALAAPVAWLLCHGLALHAAGFFMPRGIRWFGWIFVLLGSLLALAAPHDLSLRSAHLVMGGTFGLGHLAYGLYLRATERKAAV